MGKVIKIRNRKSKATIKKAREMTSRILNSLNDVDEKLNQYFDKENPAKPRKNEKDKS